MWTKLLMIESHFAKFLFLNFYADKNSQGLYSALQEIENNTWYVFKFLNQWYLFFFRFVKEIHFIKFSIITKIDYFIFSKDYHQYLTGYLLFLIFSFQKRIHNISFLVIKIIQTTLICFSDNLKYIYYGKKCICVGRLMVLFLLSFIMYLNVVLVISFSFKIIETIVLVKMNKYLS